MSSNQTFFRLNLSDNFPTQGFGKNMMIPPRVISIPVIKSEPVISNKKG